jgi:hypothetical protein
MGMRTLMALGFLVAASLTAAPASAQVSVNVNIGPPPIIFHAPPRVVVVPKTPVAYVPDTTYNVFLYQDRYWSFHEGHWFLASSHRGPWVTVNIGQVPQPLLGVPVRYYKVPPGHAKHGHWKAGGDHPGRGPKHARGRDRDDDDRPGRGRGKHKD